MGIDATVTLGPPGSVPAGWPDATNTGIAGAGVTMGTLTALNGYQVNTPGTVIERRNVTGPITVNAANVTIRDCYITAGAWGIEVMGAADGLLVEDCTIVGGANCGVMDDGYADNVTYRRLNISGGRDGMKLSGTGRLIENCYIHDLDTSGVDPHNDGIQCYSGNGWIFRGNHIISPDTSCIAMFNGQGSWSDVLIDGNLFDGNPAYAVYAPGPGASNIRMTGNTFGGWLHGPVTDWLPEWVWTGNVRKTTGVPVNP